MIPIKRLLAKTLDMERGAPALIETLRGCRIVYLSPHYDDICFSLGIMAREIGAGTIVNIFTRSNHLANPAFAARGPWTIGEVAAERDGEDERFAKACGLDRISLGLDDPPTRGRRHRDLSFLAADRAELAEPLAQAIDGLGSGADRPLALFCPAGIGDHVNHLATLFEVVDRLTLLEERHRVFFYEDLPYAARFWRRQQGLRRLMGLFPGRRAIRHVLMLGGRGREKLDLVNLYASQHDRPPSLSRFSPRTLIPRGVHEALWEFPPN
jgi:LmbE family N-acetylglucosaminyl deacetylase